MAVHHFVPLLLRLFSLRPANPSELLRLHDSIVRHATSVLGEPDTRLFRVAAYVAVMLHYDGFRYSERPTIEPGPET